MRSNKMTVLIAVLLGMTVSASQTLKAAEEKHAKEDGPAKAEEPVKKKKKGPTKKPEYFRWKDAAAVAKAWEQPVLVFVDLEDSKVCSRVRAATVGDRHFKDFVKENCVYYRYKVPRVEVKRGRRNRGTVNKKDDVPKPDFEAVKESEKVTVNKILDGKKNSFPGIALVKPEGQLIDVIGFDSEEPSLSAFVDELKGAFEKGKYEFVIPKNFQKVLNAEAKKRAALEKRNKK